MRNEVKAVVVTFSTTVAAMEAEAYFKSHGLPGRLGPIPPGLEAGCGLGWMAPADKEDELSRELKDADVAWDDIKLIDVPEEELEPESDDV